MDCVYLPAAPESPFDLFDTPQPFQGCFPNIVSIYEKDGLRKTGWLPMNRGKGGQDERNQSQDKNKFLHSYNHQSPRPPFLSCSKKAHRANRSLARR